jgi:hypothetical protein
LTFLKVGNFGDLNVQEKLLAFLELKTQEKYIKNFKSWSFWKLRRQENTSKFFD